MRTRSLIALCGLSVLNASFLCVFAEPSRNAPLVSSKVWEAFDRGEPATKVWIFFADKGHLTAAERTERLRDIAASYNKHAVERRKLRGTAVESDPSGFGEHDLPLWRSYVRGVLESGARLAFESRWLNAISVRVDRAQVERIASLNFVSRIEIVNRARSDPTSVGADSATPVVADADPFYGLAHDQLAMINLISLHEQGFTGQGVIVGVLDTGFQRSHEAFTDPDHPIQIVAEWDFVKNDPNTAYEVGDPTATGPFGTLHQHSHGTFILGVLGGYKPGKLIGGAYDASFVLAKVEDVSSELPIEEDRYVAGLEFVEQHGADLATSSLGYDDWLEYADMDGQTAVSSRAVNIATAMGLICITGVGNGGRDTDLPSLIAPSDALDVIACGAVVHNGSALTDFSSSGPTADGRVKPEVLALGEDASSVSDTVNDQYNSLLDGTSLATPLVASAVACIVQAHPNWTVAQIRQNLFKTASEFRARHAPDMFGRGYGIVNAYQAAQDCNDNDVADWLDLAQASTFDCNANGIIDRCDRAGDWNADLEIDLTDFAAHRTCTTAPCSTTSCSNAPVFASCCALADFDDDGDVDLADFAEFQLGFSAP